VVAVPLSISRLRERGFNQAEWIAARLARKLELPSDFSSLRKIRETEAQSTLSKARRRVNLRKSFEWKKGRESPRTALLVDDVHTTGATLEACARALKKAGCQEVYAWTLFRAP